MKKIIYTTIFIFIFTLSAKPLYAVTQWCDDANISMCHNIETGSGETLVDQSSESNDGSFLGAGEPAWSATVPSFGGSGTSNYSVDFDGGDDIVSMGDYSNKPTATMTGVAWVLADTVGTFETIAKNWASSGGGFHFGVEATPFELSIYISETDNDVIGPVQDTVVLPTGSWQHVAFVADGSNLRLYRNGSEIGTPAAYDGTIKSSLACTTVGGKYALDNCTVPEQYFDGHIDEFSIFADAKDSTDINDIMDNGLVQVVPNTILNNVTVN